MRNPHLTHGAPMTLLQVASRVDDRLCQFFDEMAAEWGAVNAALREPVTVLTQMTRAGGKRLRPAFCYWAFVGAGGDADDPSIIDVGAGLELLHFAILIHDELMDLSSVRRGP